MDAFISRSWGRSWSAQPLSDQPVGDRYIRPVWLDGDLSVNVAGSMMMGMMAALLAVVSMLSDPVGGFVLIGFPGALTTFFSFALDAHSFFQRGEMLARGLYLLASVCLSVVGFYVGFLGVRLVAGQR